MSLEDAHAAAPVELVDVMEDVVNDYLDECDDLSEVDSRDLAEQLAAAVMERPLPPGVTFVPKNDAVRQAWGH